MWHQMQRCGNYVEIMWKLCGKALQKDVAEQIEGNRIWGSQKRNRVF